MATQCDEQFKRNLKGQDGDNGSEETRIIAVDREQWKTSVEALQLYVA